MKMSSRTFAATPHIKPAVAKSLGRFLPVFFIIFILYCTFNDFHIQAQEESSCVREPDNLIKNPRFEDYRWNMEDCGQEIFLFSPSINCTCNPWYNVCGWMLSDKYGDPTDLRPNTGTPDIFRNTQCQISYPYPDEDVTIYTGSGNGNYMGKQASKHWSEDLPTPNYAWNYSYAGFGNLFTYNENNKLVSNNGTYYYQASEYLVQELCIPYGEGNCVGLTTNRVYKFSFLISKADNQWIPGNLDPAYGDPINISFKHVGVLFSVDNLVDYENACDISGPIEPGLWDGIKVLSNFKLDTTGNNFGTDDSCRHWMKVEGVFAVCYPNSYRYMYIGHFNHDIRNEIDNFVCDEKHIYECYYYVTDVVLEDITDSRDCDSFPECHSDPCGYEIITHPVLSPLFDHDPCYPGKCCTNIFIKKTWADTNSYRFNFAKVFVKYNNDDDDVYKDIVPISYEDMMRFRQGDSILIYTACHDYPEEEDYIPIKVRVQLFNSVDSAAYDSTCDRRAGWWWYPATKNTNVTCPCICDKKQDSATFHFEPVYSDPDHCCYMASINNTLDCNLMLKDITARISKYEHPYWIPVTDSTDDGFNFEETPLWTEIVPFPDTLNEYKWEYHGFRDYLRPGEMTEIAKICLPKDGEVYKFSFYDGTLGDLGGGPSECNYEFEAQCYPNLDSCCDYITVTIDPDGTLTADCCYFVYIKSNDTTSCEPLFFKVWTYDSEGDPGVKIGEEYYTNGIDGDPRGRKFGPFCSNAYGMDSLKVDVYFVREGDTTVCINSKSVVCPVEACCDSTTVTITKQPEFDNGTSCCFDLEVHRDSSIACDSLMIEVWDESIGSKINVTPDSVTIPPGESHFQLCLNKTDFHGDSTLNVKVMFVNKYGIEVCSKSETLIACQEISGCTPDYTDFQWKEPIEEDSVTLVCPFEPNDTCHIKYTYTYRHVKVGDISIHRDIQVLTWNMDCNCEIANFSASIIAKIWDNSEVKNAFDIDSLGRNIDPNDSICFTNFRVVTSDCWKYVHPHVVDGAYNPGGYRRCNDTICCYQTYMVCYLKRISDGKMVFDSFTRLDTLAQTPDTCTAPCNPNNCNVWSPFSSDGQLPPIGKFSVDHFKEIKSEGCDIKISSEEVGNLLNIRLKCREKGDVIIQVFDLLGNTILSERRNKNAVEMNIPVALNLSPGIYFCLVKLNDNIYHYEKFIILK